MEGSFPNETSVLLELHAKERIWKGREIIVIYAGVDESCWQANLSGSVLEAEGKDQC